MIHQKAFTDRKSRRGVLVPIVAFALVAVMGGIALVLDRMWLDMARLEMRTGAEAAALAAARELVNDDLIRNYAGKDLRISNARNKAKFVAAQNPVAGTPLTLNTGLDGDVRLGRLRVPAGYASPVFFETTENPNTAVVIARRIKQRNNPVALILNGYASNLEADVIITAEATIDNHISGLRPLPGATAPVLPLAILDADPAGKCEETWQNRIDGCRGADQYGVDELSGAVQSQADGIPEIRLTFDGQDANAYWLPFHSSHPEQDLPRMIQSGIGERELESCGGVLDSGNLPVLAGFRRCTTQIEQACRGRTGLCHACLLYSGNSTDRQIRCARLVAARIVNCNRDARGNLTLTLQPGVMETRTAIPSRKNVTASLNPYIYHLSLTH